MSFNSASLFTVEEVCYKKKFVVPEFQRGYAWQEEHWKALWDDAANLILRSHAQHYAGAIMISAVEDEQLEVDLIDGQQRLTSIALMLSALGGEAFQMKFKNNEPLQTYYDYYALKHTHLAPSLAQHKSYYARNLAQAAKYFSERALKVTQETRNALIDALLKRFRLFVLVIHTEFDVHVAFETINNRGKPLSTLEKLKNRLIYLSSNAQDKDAGRRAAGEIHRCWKSVYASLGAGKSLLDDDEFLNAHSRGWFKHERKAEWLNSRLFDEEFSAHGEMSPEGIITYVRSLEQAAACWYFINEPDDLPPKVTKQLMSLQKTASASSKPLLLWALIRLANEHPKLIVAPNEDLAWSKPFEHITLEAERFAVLVVLANNRLSNVGQGDLNRSAYALAHPDEPFQANLSNLAEASTSLEAVTFACDHLKSIITNWDDVAQQYLDNRFQWQGYFDSNSVQTVIADRLRKGDGFYAWQFGKLLIYLWEDRLRGERGRPEKKPWDRFAWDESVEHIYPQNPVQQWNKSITLDGRSSKSMRDAVTNSIGNLLLLSRSINSTVSNGAYRASGQNQGKQSHYAGGSYSEMQVARICQDWTVVQIAARGIAMMRSAQKKWNFEVVGAQDKLTDWLPFLFGDQAHRVSEGAYSNGRRIDGRILRRWVDQFEASN